MWITTCMWLIVYTYQCVKRRLLTLPLDSPMHSWSYAMQFILFMSQYLNQIWITPVTYELEVELTWAGIAPSCLSYANRSEDPGRRPRWGCQSGEIWFDGMRLRGSRQYRAWSKRTCGDDMSLQRPLTLDSELTKCSSGAHWTRGVTWLMKCRGCVEVFFLLWHITTLPGKAHAASTSRATYESDLKQFDIKSILLYSKYG